MKKRHRTHKDSKRWICIVIALVLLFVISLSIFLYKASLIREEVFDNYIYLEADRDLSAQELELSREYLENRVELYHDFLYESVKIEGDMLVVQVHQNVLNDTSGFEVLLEPLNFEAKIGDEVVFSSSDGVADVCTSVECSGLDPIRGCGQIVSNGTISYVCGTYFSLKLTPQAAQRQSDIIDALEPIEEVYGSSYLSKNLDLYLDGELFDYMRISDDLQGQVVTDISVSGSGTGETQDQAAKNAIKRIKHLQAALISEPLPARFSIVEIR